MEQSTRDSLTRFIERTIKDNRWHSILTESGKDTDEFIIQIH